MILKYLLIGFIFTFIVDVICTTYKNHKSFRDIPEWGWKERIICIILWPIAAFIFLKAYFKTLFK